MTHTPGFLRRALCISAAVLAIAAQPALAGSGHRGHRGHHGAHWGFSGHLGHHGGHHLGHHGSLRRHHGLGHGGFHHAGSVRRYHGLGHGYYYPAYLYPHRSYSYYPWLSYGRPSYGGSSRVIVVEPGGYADRRSAQRPPRVEPTYEGGSRGWALLSAGDAPAAQRIFAAAALSDPSDEVHKAGFALAAALRGRHETAVWAMRRAFRIDPAPLHYLDIDERLARRIHDLAERYADQARRDTGNVDDMFMTAALNYMLHADEDARRAAKAALERGDVHPSTRSLYERLRENAEPADISPESDTAGAPVVELDGSGQATG